MNEIIDILQYMLDILLDFFQRLFCWTFLMDYFVKLFVGLFCWTILLDFHRRVVPSRPELLLQVFFSA